MKKVLLFLIAVCACGLAYRSYAQTEPFEMANPHYNNPPGLPGGSGAFDHRCMSYQFYNEDDHLEGGEWQMYEWNGSWGLDQLAAGLFGYGWMAQMAFLLAENCSPHQTALVTCVRTAHRCESSILIYQ